MLVLLQKLKAIWSGNRILILVTILFTLAFVSILWLSTENRRAVQRYRIAENNVAVLQDSVRTTTDKYNQAVYSKKTFVVQTPQDLEELTKPLYDELKKLAGKIESIQQTNVVVKPPDINVPIVPISPHKYNFSFDSTYNPGNFESFKGQFDTESLSTSLEERKLGISLITALRRNKDGTGEIVVKSTFPGLTVTSIQGAQIGKDVFKTEAQKQKRLSLGFQIGYSPISYDLTNGKLELRNQITGGFGINIRLK